MIAGLRRHEEGHRDHARHSAERLYEQLLALPSHVRVLRLDGDGHRAPLDRLADEVMTVDSQAANLEDIVLEVAAARITERGATRADDAFSETAMEDRKREGYF